MKFAFRTYTLGVLVDAFRAYNLDVSFKDIIINGKEYPYTIWLNVIVGGSFNEIYGKY